MARTGRAERPVRASRFRHCASVPPALLAGMLVQAVVPRSWGSATGGPARALEAPCGRSGRTLRALPGVQSNNYWSSSTNASNPNNAWNANLNNNYVWPVRGGE